MKLGLIGDVHAEDIYLEATLNHFSTLNLDAILCVGDIADGHGSVDRCVELLESYSVVCVMGNHDEWLLDNFMRGHDNATSQTDINSSSYKFLSELPETYDFSTPDGLLLLSHGVGHDNMARLNVDDFNFSYTLENNSELQAILASRKYSFVVAGHTHKPFVHTYRNVTFINAGTLHREHEPVFSIFDTKTKVLHLIDVRQVLGA